MATFLRFSSLGARLCTMVRAPSSSTSTCTSCGVILRGAAPRGRGRHSNRVPEVFSQANRGRKILPSAKPVMQTPRRLQTKVRSSTYTRASAKPRGVPPCPRPQRHDHGWGIADLVGGAYTSVRLKGGPPSQLSPHIAHHFSCRPWGHPCEVFQELRYSERGLATLLRPSGAVAQLLYCVGSLGARPFLVGLSVSCLVTCRDEFRSWYCLGGLVITVVATRK